MEVYEYSAVTVAIILEDQAAEHVELMLLGME